MKIRNLVIFGLVVLTIGLVYYVRYDAEKSPEVSTQKIPQNIQVEPVAKEPAAEVQELEIPQKVYQLIRYIRQFNQPPPNHIGGRIFQNREKLLPLKDTQGKTILYREWDVHPKKKGVNRGPERVITGSDNSSYYTRDHYTSFIKIDL
jgi:ribonuclease T1